MLCMLDSLALLLHDVVLSTLYIYKTTECSYTLVCGNCSKAADGLGFHQMVGKDWLSFCRIFSRFFQISSVLKHLTHVHTCSVFLYSSSGLVTESSSLTLSVDCWYSFWICCIISRPDLLLQTPTACLKAIYRGRRPQYVVWKQSTGEGGHNTWGHISFYWHQ